MDIEISTKRNQFRRALGKRGECSPLEKQTLLPRTPVAPFSSLASLLPLTKCRHCRLEGGSSKLSEQLERRSCGRSSRPDRRPCYIRLVGARSSDGVARMPRRRCMGSSRAGVWSLCELRVKKPDARLGACFCRRRAVSAG